MKTVKLIPGKQNVLLTKLPVGYAEGVQKPTRRVKKEKPFNPVIVLRKLKVA